MTTELAEIKKIGHNISFCPAFCELFINLNEFLKGCHFFVIYCSLSCKSNDIGELSGTNEQ